MDSAPPETYTYLHPLARPDALPIAPPASSPRLTVNCIHALRLIPRRLAAASTFASNARSKRSITGDLRGSAPCPASSASVAIGSAFGLAAPAMKASAAASSIGDLGLLFGLRAIAIEIHSAIIMLYKYRADQCGQLVDRLGVTRRLLPYRPALGRRVRERLAPHYRRGQIGRAHVELQSLMRISYAVFCLKKKTSDRNSTQLTTCNTETRILLT